MTPQQVDQAASALAAARSGRPIAALPEAARPQSEADSYAIQDAVLRRLGERVGGRKVGFSPEGGIFCAPIYASSVHASPASLPAHGLHVIGIECEIGFRVNAALVPRTQPYTRDEVLAAASLHPTKSKGRVRRDNALCRQRHDKQDNGDARMRRPGQTSGQQHVDQRLGRHRPEQHPQARCILVWCNQRQQVLQRDQHQTEADAYSTVIAGSRHRASAEHQDAEQHEQKRDAAHIEGKRLDD
jgi:hypothetical protein